MLSYPDAYVLQRGGVRRWDKGNRFNGFLARSKTAKAVTVTFCTPSTPLKRGVNESGSALRVPRRAVPLPS